MSKYVIAAECAEAISKKYNIPLYDLVDLFADIPAVDVAPKSEWKSGKTPNGQWGYYCSICTASFVGENAEWIAKSHDYCPNCGAKMKGGAE